MHSALAISWNNIQMLPNNNVNLYNNKVMTRVQRMYHMKTMDEQEHDVDECDMYGMDVKLTKCRLVGGFAGRNVSNNTAGKIDHDDIKM